ncbi:MAG: hypothetical protein JKY25_03420 [Robiginitomaculum sp.]|nr:hypothetical protein [Robiginitomaculum sp.]
MSFEHPVFILLHVAGFAFFISLALSGFMIFAGFLDKPDHRSNHKTPVPTAGGIGIVAGLGAGLLALAMFYPDYGDHNLLGSIAALGFGVAVLGLFDDVYRLNSKLKFALIMVLAGAAVAIIGPPFSFPVAVVDVPIPYWIGFGGALLWVFVVTNGVNFIDGSNGMMAVSMTVAFLAIAVVAVLVGASSAAILSVVMAAALIGFAPYNSGNRARIFGGDVGSLLVGYGYGTSALILVAEAPKAGVLYVGSLLILPFLTDILLTMLLRLRRRENLLAPHKSHLYQRLIAAGKSHASVSILYGYGAVLMAAVTIAALWFGLIRSLFFLALWVNIMLMIYLTIHKKLTANSPAGQRNPPDV